jgi:hypothetical protein
MSPTSNSDGWRFDQVLEAVGRAATAEVGASAAAAYRGRIVLECLLEQAGRAPSPTRDTLAELYVDVPQQLPLDAAKPSDYAAVAEELGLRPGLTSRQLSGIRRAFALANHPDRVPSPRRGPATRRMAIANILIDRALKEGRNRS